MFLGLLMVVGMFFTSVRWLEIGLAIVGVGATLAMCPIGMRRNPELSDFTNMAKVVSYPATVALAVLTVVLHEAIVANPDLGAFLWSLIAD